MDCEHCPVEDCLRFQCIMCGCVDIDIEYFSLEDEQKNLYEAQQCVCQRCGYLWTEQTKRQRDNRVQAMKDLLSINPDQVQLKEKPEKPE